MEDELKVKNSKFVSRNIELNQEFQFAAEKTKFAVNDIYNSSWYGSVLWDLFCPGAVKLESSWNRSVKIMLDLPYSTHRGFIEPLSGRKHLKRVLLKRFIQFVENIRKSKKPLLKWILQLSERNTNSTTGKNLRGIMLLTGKQTIEDIELVDVDNFSHFPRPEEDEWKLGMVKHLVAERNTGGLTSHNWSGLIICAPASHSFFSTS